MKLSKALKYIILSASLLLPATTWADSQTQKVVDTFAGQPKYAYTNIGIYLQELESGKPVAEYNSNMPLSSASTIKTVTSASALAILGEDYRFHTQVKLIGEQKDNTFYGDLVVIGAGDPTLDSNYMPKSQEFVKQIVTALETRGIKQLVGRLRLDQGNYASFGNSTNIELEDPGTEYGAGVYALNYKDNVVPLKISSKQGLLKAELPRPYPYRVSHQVQLGKTEAITIFPYATEQAEFYIIGEFPANSKPRVYEVGNPKPELELFYTLEKACGEHNIKIVKTNTTPSSAVQSLLLDHSSPRLAEIIKSLLVRSDNMYADALLLELAKANKKAPTRANGVQVIKNYWQSKQLDCTPLYMYGGSGLSRRNAVSPRFLAQFLATAEKNKGNNSVTFSKLMPRLSQDLYISNSLSTAALGQDLSAKSGGMTGVRCYTGYYPAEKPRYTWSIMLNHFHNSDNEVRNDIGKLLVKMLKDK